MAASMGTKAERVARDRELNEALLDMAGRVARNDPDWGIYFPGDARPHIPRWRRLLKL